MVPAEQKNSGLVQPTSVLSSCSSAKMSRHNCRGSGGAAEAIVGRTMSAASRVTIPMDRMMHFLCGGNPRECRASRARGHVEFDRRVPPSDERANYTDEVHHTPRPCGPSKHVAVAHECDVGAVGGPGRHVDGALA